MSKIICFILCFYFQYEILQLDGYTMGVTIGSFFSQYFHGKIWK